MALHSFTDFGLHMPANGALFAVVIGVVVGLEGTRPEREETTSVWEGAERSERNDPVLVRL
jgi:hypothetical protein